MYIKVFRNAKKGSKTSNRYARVDHIKTTLYRLLPDQKGGLKTPSGKRNGKTILVSYDTLNYALKNSKVHTIDVGNTRSN